MGVCSVVYCVFIKFAVTDLHETNQVCKVAESTLCKHGSFIRYGNEMQIDQMVGIYRTRDR